jgi:transcriptional regulator with XRE-family HTH domain
MVKRVKLVRIAQGYPSYKFAALVSVHPNWWREIEMGTREPSNSVMLRASEILHRPVAELFADAEEALV